MHRSIAHSRAVQPFSFHAMPLLDEEFDQSVFAEDTEMLLETPFNSIHFVGESDEY